MHCLILDQMITIQDENERPWHGGDLIDKTDQKRLTRRSVGQMQRYPRAFARTGVNGLKGGNQNLEKADRRIVSAVERQPT